MSVSSSTDAVRVTTPAPRWFIANRISVLIDGAATGGVYDQVDMLLPSGDMPPLHVHRDADEGFNVLEGTLELYVGGETFVVSAGSAKVAPSGVPHSYRVVSDEPARVLVTCSPAGFADFLVGASDIAEGEGLPPEGLLPDFERVGREAAAVGIDVLGPPGMLPSDLG